jgi:hypothetical protein
MPTEPARPHFSAFCAFSLLAALSTICAAAAAQNAPKLKEVPPPPGSHLLPLPKGGPTPRTRDGHPDLSGVWFPGLTGGYDVSDPPAQLQFDPKVTPEEKPPYQPWAAAKIAAMSPVDFELHRPSVNCLPRGVPALFLANPYPLQLIQSPGQLAQLNELNNNWRVIPTDGRPHAKDPDPTFYGDETGHWEGDTLVIDVIAMDERSWNTVDGWFHSDQQHVIERLSRPDMNHLIYQVTIEDPKVLTKPWTSVPRHWSLSHEPLEEYFCTDNQELEQYNELKKKEAASTAPSH